MRKNFIYQNRRSSNLMAHYASLVLHSPNSSYVAKQLAASVLSQAASSYRRTSSRMASLAGYILNSRYSYLYSYGERALAGSVLSQRFQEEFQEDKIKDLLAKHLNKVAANKAVDLTKAKFLKRA
jgi:hypothetical protein